MRFTTVLSFMLVLVGALVWLLVGVFDFNLVAFVFGTGNQAVVSRIIYTLVGLSALWMMFVWAVYHPFEKVN